MMTNKIKATRQKVIDELLAPIHALNLRKPGLFITGTDTGVGKTVVTCAIAHCLKQTGMKVSVCKPMATGCRREREGLVAEDAEAIAHFSDCRLPLDVINPVRFVPPMSPAAAADQAGVEVDFQAISDSLTRLDEWGDVQLVEGVGGLCTPISAKHPGVTILELAAAIGYPVLIVCRAGLGTLSHTAMTARLLNEANLHIAGLVVNGYIADSAGQSDDASMAGNRRWLERMNKVSIIATLPQCDLSLVRPEAGRISEEVLEAAAMARWEDHLRMAQPV